MTAPTERSIELRAFAERAAERLSRVPGLDAVVLFGSAAQGTAEEHSDCDLAVAGTERACEEARVAGWALAKNERVPCDIVGMHPGNRYAGYGVRAMVGTESIRRGRVLWGDPNMEGEDRAMDLQEVTVEQDTVTSLLTSAVRHWLDFHEFPGKEGFHKTAATAIGSVVERAGKATIAYRGGDPSPTHALDELFEDAARKARGRNLGPAVIAQDPDAAAERFEELGAELNGDTRRDHLTIYRGEKPVSKKPQLDARLARTLRLVREDRELLIQARGMKGLTEELVPAEGKLCTALEEVLKAKPAAPNALIEAARLWVGTKGGRTKARTPPTGRAGPAMR